MSHSKSIQSLIVNNKRRMNPTNAPPLSILLLFILWTTRATMAFVLPERRQRAATDCEFALKQRATFRAIPSRGDAKASCHFSTALSNKSKNTIDEILDALDTMLGVSPLSEADLKASGQADLKQRAERREQMAPPRDALNKKSVILFFFFLGLVPVVTLFSAVKWGGVKPFNL